MTDILSLWDKIVKFFCSIIMEKRFYLWRLVYELLVKDKKQKACIMFS